MLKVVIGFLGFAFVMLAVFIFFIPGPHNLTCDWYTDKGEVLQTCNCLGSKVDVDDVEPGWQRNVCQGIVVGVGGDDFDAP